MKIEKLLSFVLGVALAGILSASAQTQIVTLTTTNGGTTLILSQMAVTPGQVVTLLYASARTNTVSFCQVTLTNGVKIYPYFSPNQIWGYGVLNLGQMTLTGATNIALYSYAEAAATFSITTPPPQTQNYIPANAVVIPTDATGPVQIILESSSDLVNWNATSPGTYGNTYSNRFFRVRAVAGQ